MYTKFLRENFNLEKVTEFSLKNIKREDIIYYPDDINSAYGTNLSFGGYYEKRSFYKSESKIIHTGLDIFIKQGEKIFSPFSGFISNIIYFNPKKYEIGNGTGVQVVSWHSFDQVKEVLGVKKTKEIFKDKKFLKIVFIHLDIDYFKKNKKIKFKKKKINNNILKYISLNSNVKKGETIGVIGNRYNNGGWAPHTHVEASMHDKIEKINFKDEKDIFKKIAIGTIYYKNKEELKKLNLINPNLFLGLDKIAKEKKEMSLNNKIEQEDIISVKNLSLGYNIKKNIINDISFNLKRGEILAILGPSGCGKTSLLNSISGFIKYHGEIKINNYGSTTNIGYVFQDNVVYDSISVYKNIFIGALFNLKYKFDTYINIWKKEKLSSDDFKEMQNIISLFKIYSKNTIYKRKFERRFNSFIRLFNKKYFKVFFKKELHKDVVKVMKILKIEDISKNKPSEISGGQKQRLAIAKSVIKKPQILIMDEPLSSLDAKIKDETRDWIKKIQKIFDITLIFVTHDQNDALLISDKILLMNKNGQVDQYDSPGNIFHNPSTQFTAKFIGWPEINLVNELKGKKYYVRPQNIFINNDLKHNCKIVEKKTNGHNFIYEVIYKGKEITVVTKEKYNIGDKINIYWNKESEIIFDEKGKRIFKKR